MQEQVRSLPLITWGAAIVRRPAITEHPVGFRHSAYFTYGVHIPLTERTSVGEAVHHIDPVSHTTNRQDDDVGHLTAGNYDDGLFLVTKCTRIEFSSYEHVTADPDMGQSQGGTTSSL
ncbi:hypothetical protein [Streptomyces sp. NPDC056061]|uniref:hypothetical protein n=1 Tax=Streptomyces sp. NPDC056061 TaxID=3345700 RepID=UPI0035DDC2DA